MRRVLLSVLLAGTLACNRTTPYKRPAVPAPPAYRGAAPEAAATRSLGEETWWTVFADPQLQELVRKALTQNFDQRIAAERILQARAQLGITHADERPGVGGAASFSSQRLAKGEMGANREAVLLNFGRLGLGAAWNLDFWGRYRNATEAARAQLLATEWAQRAVHCSVVSAVAGTYFQLRTLDLELEIARRTRASREESLDLTRKLEAGGSASLLDVREAEQLVLSADAQIIDLERQAEQMEDTLCTLLGETPHAIARGLTLDQQPRLPVVPAGIPSELLERRPDIRAAEAAIMAANAEIGVVRSAYFPQIALTGTAGSDTNALTRLFTGPSYVWNYGPSLSVPLFDRGRIRNAVTAAESRKREAELNYRKTVATAFGDVARGLVAYRKSRELRLQQEKIVASAGDALRLARIRFEHGQSSYLEVLMNDRAQLGAQFELTFAKQGELLSLVQLYNALGGGWKQ
jgi:multidrug efflux system outer membrane protein